MRRLDTQVAAMLSGFVACDPLHWLSFRFVHGIAVGRNETTTIAHSDEHFQRTNRRKSVYRARFQLPQLFSDGWRAFFLTYIVYKSRVSRATPPHSFRIHCQIDPEWWWPFRDQRYFFISIWYWVIVSTYVYNKIATTFIDNMHVNMRVCFM